MATSVREQEVLETVQSVLNQFLTDARDGGAEPIGPGSHLVEFGVNSVQLLQIHARLEDALGLQIPAAALFDCDTVGGLASYLAGQS